MNRQFERRRRHIIRHSTENPTNALVPTGDQSVVPRQADNDAELVELWLHGRSAHTQRAYLADVRRFLFFAEKSLAQVTLGDIQRFADDLEVTGLKPASVHRILSAVKSVFAFGHRLGYLRFDVGRPLKLQGFRDGLADRILDEGEVQRMIALEPTPRNQMLLVLLYASGARVSEVAALKWKHLQPRENGQAQMTVFGKGGKTRSILLPRSVWSKLAALPQSTDLQSPIFRSRKKGGHLSSAQITRIVRKAAERAGIPKAVTAHWLRHCHGSHALDRGAGIHLVQSTLGHSSIATTGRYLHARPSDSSAQYLPL